MKHAFFICFLLLSIAVPTLGQELFPNSESASNVPKGVIGVRLSTEDYNILNFSPFSTPTIGPYFRSMDCLKLMYGLGAKWSVYATSTVSNHHDSKLPAGYFSDDGKVYHSHNILKGAYPFLFEGVNIYSKYRFLTFDDNESHIRMAMYNELSLNHVAHDEAEPSLIGDNSGFGSGIIITKLKNKFAASLTTGFIIPFKYSESQGHEFTSGNAFNYSLSLGYKAFPFTYKNYEQTNLNVYVELMGVDYGKATLGWNGKNVNITGVYALQAGNVIDIRPGLQLIIKSNLRLDFSTAYSLIGTSYTKIFPVYYLGIQRYFYLK